MPLNSHKFHIFIEYNRKIPAPFSVSIAYGLNDISSYLLRVGVSIFAKVDIHQSTGELLPQLPVE